jgi:hypothetical protein
MHAASTSLVPVGEIAARAGVRPAAVSNWRRRHRDFPAPVERAHGRDLFRWEEVEEWLRSRGREFEASRAEAGRLLGGGEQGRGREVARALLALDVLAGDALRRAVCAAGGDAEIGRDVVALAREVHRERAEARDLFASLFEAEPSDIGVLARTLIPSRAGPERATVGSFESLLDAPRGSRLDPHATARSLADLVVRLTDVARADSVFDPAAGEGGFLLRAAEVARANGPGRAISLFGQERDLATWRLAKQRLLVHGLEADLRCGDSLADSAFRELRVDAVVCDPPFGLRVPADAWSPTDTRWRFGMPPKNADLAWVQLAIYHLREHGRACVLLPAGSLYRGGHEARIRVELLRGRAVEAIVALPANTATSSAVPVALWLLRPPDAEGPGQVLLVDAGADEMASGRRASRPAGISSELCDKILGTLGRWRGDIAAFEQVPEFAAAVSVEALIGADGDLVPARWTRGATAADTQRVIADLHRRAHRLDEVRAQLGKHPAVELPLRPRAGEARRVRLGELIAEETLELIAGARADRNSDPEASGPPVTRPGDIVVAPGPHGPRVSVEEVGGRPIRAPRQVLRIKADWLDPHVLAAFVASPENLRMATGSVARVNLRELEVPLLEPAEISFLRQRLDRLEEEGEAARESAESAQALRESLVSAFARGIVEPDVDADDVDRTS